MILSSLDIESQPLLSTVEAMKIITLTLDHIRSSIIFEISGFARVRAATIQGFRWRASRRESHFAFLYFSLTARL